MDALVMCGGRGTRLDSATEKPLVEVGGTPMVDRVLDALAASRVGTVHAVVSPHTPDTRAHLEGRRGTKIVDASGDGYVADLGHALDVVEEPVLTAASDLPLLAGEVVDRVFDRFDGDSLAVYVPVSLKRDLGVSVDTTTTLDGREVAPTGLNVVGSGSSEATLVTEDERLAVNVNRPGDVDVAEGLL